MKIRIDTGLRRIAAVAAAFALALVSLGASAARLDQLVVRQGLATAEFAGDDAGQNGSGLRLTSMGRWRDARGVERYTIWRVRNAATDSKSVTLAGPDGSFSVAFTARTRTDTYLRSPVTGAAATHVLYRSGNAIDTQPASTTIWADATEIAPRAGDNREPRILSTAGTIAEAGQAYAYAPIVDDPDNDLLLLSAPTAPTGFAFDPQRGAFVFRATATQVGVHTIKLVVDDGRAPACGCDDDHGDGQYKNGDGDGDDDSCADDGDDDGDGDDDDGDDDDGDDDDGDDDDGDGDDGDDDDGDGDDGDGDDGDGDDDDGDDDDGDDEGDDGDDDDECRNNASQSWTLRVVTDFCPLLPIALADSRLATASPGQSFSQVARGTGAGNYGWLTWTGDNSAPTVAASLAPPGDSYTYVNPDNASDKLLNGGDWAQGTPGSMNSDAIRARMDALLHTDIVVPTWSATRGSGSNLDYRAARFARIRVSDYRLTGNGWLSFSFQGWKNCYNDAPVANGQSLQTGRDTSLAITLAASDPENDPLTLAIAAQPQHGSLSGTTPNLTYSPDNGYTGPDSFAFTASDGELTSEPAIVDIAVIGTQNRAPTATGANLSGAEDAPLPVVLAGTDPDGDALLFELVAQPAHGTLSGTAPHLTYVPAANFNGSDALQFRVSDGETASAPATIAIAILPANDAPTATGQELAVDEDAALPITLAGADADGDALVYTLASQPAHGSLGGAAPHVMYTPATHFHGNDEFTFVAGDGSVSTPPATIRIAVRAVNDRPVAVDLALTTERDTPLAVALGATDPDNDPLSFAISAPPQHGTLSGTAPNLTYMPASGYVGADAFEYSASDGGLSSVPAHVDVTVTGAVNRPPVATPGYASSDEDNAIVIELVGEDPDGDALTFEIVTAPAHGALSGEPPYLLYTPARDYNGTDAFTFRVADAQAVSAPAKFDLEIEPGQEPPVAAPIDRACNEDCVLFLVLRATDPEGDDLTYRIKTPPTHGAVNTVAPDTVVYRPNPDYHGADEFTFVANDGTDDSAPAPIRITIHPVNDAPAGQSQALQVEEDGSLPVTLGATDAEGDPVTYRIASAPAHGEVRGALPGELTYAPAANYFGADQFAFVANDGTSDSAPATIRIAVLAVNDSPVAVAQSLALDEDGSLAIALTATDIDGDVLSFQLRGETAHGTLSGTAPLLTYTPAANFHGVDSLSFVARDAAAESAMAPVTLTVREVNDAPVIGSTAPATLNVGSNLAYDVDATDADQDALTYALVAGPGGAAIDAASGVLDWTPTEAQQGTHAIQVEVADGRGGRATQAFELRVRGPNRPPAITSTPAGLAPDGQSYRYDAEATDPDAGDHVSFELLAAPAGMRIDAVSGAIEWSPASANPIGLSTPNARCTAPVAPGGSELARAADVIVLMDESGSMDGDQAWMREFLPRLHQRLLGLEVGTGAQPNRYGLIGFGRDTGITTYYRYADNSYLSTSPWDWYVLSRKLIASGEWEDAYEGLVGLTTRYPLAAGSARNVILVTDDARDANRPQGTPPSTITYAQTLAALQGAGIKLNAVLDDVTLVCGDGRRSMGIDARGNGYVADGAGGYQPCTGARDVTTWAEMKQQGTLALATGGAVWDLAFMRNGGPNAAAMTRLLSDIKTREILESPSPAPLADLAIVAIESTEGANGIASVRVGVVNRGLVATTQPATLELRLAGDASLLGTAPLAANLAAGARVDVDFVPAAAPAAGALQARIVVPDTLRECDGANNVAEAALAGLAARDPAGASDGQWWTLAVVERNDPPGLAPIADQQVDVSQTLALQLVGSDPDRGDALRYDLVRGPTALVLDRHSGALRFRPTSADVGVHAIEVRVGDLAGATAQRSFSIDVRASVDRGSIRIVSTPPLRTLIDTQFVYPVALEPVAGQVPRFSLPDAPAGAAIDAANGTLTWTVPASALGGRPYFVVVAEDQFGNFDAQEFRVEIERPNVAPEITGAYTRSMQAPDLYAGNPQFRDANPFDVLRWTLPLAPAGATLHPDLGRINWRAPDPAPATGVMNAQLVFDYQCPLPGRRVEELRLKRVRAIGGRGWSIPAVGPLSDSNGDNRIDGADAYAFVVADSFAHRVVAVDANTGTTLFSANPVARISSDVTPAIADLDRDGVPEILAYGGTSTERTLIALGNAGQLKWQAAQPPAGLVEKSAIRVADLHGDGAPEILLGSAVYDGNGQRIAVLGGTRRIGSHALVDIDGDGHLEIGYGPALYRADGSLLWGYQHPDGATIVDAEIVGGNFDADPAPELVLHTGNWGNIHSGGRTVLLDGNGTRIWGPVAGAVYSGKPTVADLDGNGRPDIYLTAESRALGDGGVTLWDPVGGNSSSSALAGDLNGDGMVELVEFGNGSLAHQRIGGTGQRVEIVANLGAVGAAMPTGSPIAVDLDRDGSPELAFGADAGIHVLATDGVALHAGEPVRPAAGAPDLWVGVPNARPEASRTLVDVEIVNRGVADVATPFEVVLRSGSPNRDAGPLASTTLAALRAGASTTVTFELAGFAQVPAEIFARVDPANAIVECEERNNAVLAGLYHARVTDLGGLYAEDRFSAGAVAGLGGVQIVSVAPAQAFETVPYEYRVVLATQVTSDRYRYRLLTAPMGMAIHPNTGVVTWTPPAGSTGSANVNIQVLNLWGSSTTQSFTLTVSRPANRAPAITSQALTNASAGLAYAYDVDATDADGDTLTWALTQAPSGMSIDAASGLIAWTPSTAQVGSNPVAVAVSDGRGATTTQTFAIAVTGANRGPAITSTPSNSAKAGREYVYGVLATDADGDTLNYTLTAAPPGMTLDPATHTVRWTPAAAGAVEATVRVDDGREYVDQTWPITVLPAGTALTADVSAAPRSVAPGASVTITLGYAGAAGAVTRTATVDGQPVTLDASGQAIVTSTTPGRHPVVGTVSDAYDSATDSDEFYVADPSDTTDPVVSLHSPSDAAEITAPTPIRGSVSDANLASWILAIRPSNSPNATPTILAQGSTNVADQPLATFDPTLLINGQYSIILQATDTGGRTASDAVVVRVTGDMKVGHFSITFEDASVPLAGIPIRVTRTYDSRQRDERLDFGHGWSVDYQNVRVRESARTGFSWRIEQRGGGFFPQQCAVSNGDRVVTVTLPDGAVESFRAKAEPECGEGFTPQTRVQLVYEPIDGTDSTLTQQSYGLLLLATVAGSDVYNLVDPDEPATPVDPRGYTLTTPEGVIYQLDQFLGIRRVTEPSGQSLTYSNAGIVHSSGVDIDFVRDPSGRITDLVLPDGQVISYTYTAAGDLESVTDQADHTTTFAYGLPAFAHYLTDITDPRGVRVARNEYDDDGRLVATIDADGHRIEYDHDIAGRTEQVRDRRGSLMTYVYDDHGWVLSEANALGETTRHTYDADGNELTRTDGEGHTTTWTYDPRGNALTESNPLGQTTTSTYDGRNSLLTQVDALGRTVMTSAYDSRTGALLSTRDALDHATGFGYDSGIGSGQTGELTAMTDAANQITRFELDPQNRGWRVAEVDPLGHRTTYTHDALGRVLTETRTRTVPDPVGAASAATAASKSTAATAASHPTPVRAQATDPVGATGVATAAHQSTSVRAKAIQTLVTRYAYDAKGRITRTDLPDGTFAATEYNAIDKPIRECDAHSRCTEHVHDARGHETETRYPDGSSETKTYDANGNVTTQTDRAGRTTRMVYDAANRLIETIQPDATPGNAADNPRTTHVYDDAGRLTATTDERDHTTSYEYDAANRRTRVTLPAVGAAIAATRVTTYDAAGRRLTETDANGRTTTFVYDAAGRLTQTQFADGTTARVEYDALGRKTAEIDPAQRRTEYAYDALGRLIRVTLAAGTPAATVTTYAYDEAGNRITQTDAESRTTRWTFDAVGRELTRTLPLAQAESTGYDTLGRRASHTDFRGRTTSYAYDTLDRPTGIDYPADPDVATTYTTSGQRATVSDGRGTTTYAYDVHDRLVRKTEPDGLTIEYAYDVAGNLVSRVSPNQSLVYTYDARHRLASVVRTVDGEPAQTTTYAYDAAGNRTAMTGADGTRTEYGYDLRHRLTGLVKRSAAGALVVGMAYTVDASGMRTAVVETDPAGTTRSVGYAYDGLKRLTREAIVHRDATRHRTSTWTYDRVGNRLTQTVATGEGTVGAASAATLYTYDQNDRLLTESTSLDAGPAALTSYTYDLNGNTLTKVRPTGPIEYTYDDANRLAEMRQAGERTTYAYDADGLRIAQTRIPATGDSTTTRYLQDPTYAYSQVVEQWTRTGTAVAQLEATYAFADDLIAQTRYANAGQTATPTTRYVQADGFGSVRWLTDAAGAITDAVDYDAFGNEIARSGTTPTEHLYRGEQFDPNLGFYYLRARYMDPSAGRFVGMDPFNGFLADPMSIHEYLFVGANPVNRADPSGLCDCNLTSQIQANNIGGIVTTSSVRSGAQVTANRAAGKALENYVRSIIEREFGGAVFFRPKALTGPGGKRVYDILVKIGDRLINIEVKKNLPLGGTAFRRLVGQIRTFLAPAEASAQGAEVIVFAEGATEQAAARLATTLAMDNPPIVSTAIELVQLIRGLVIGI